MSNLKVVSIADHQVKKKRYEYSLYASCVAFFAISSVYFFADVNEKYAVYFFQAEVVVSFVIGYLCLKSGRKSSAMMKAFIGYSIYTMVANIAFPPASSLQWFLELFLFFFFAFCFSLKEQL